MSFTHPQTSFLDSEAYSSFISVVPGIKPRVLWMLDGTQPLNDRPSLSWCQYLNLKNLGERGYVRISQEPVTCSEDYLVPNITQASY